MVKRQFKKLILYKLVVGATPAGTARAENPFFSRHREKNSWSRARGKRP